MIEYNPKLWLKLIFHSYTRHIVRRLFPSLVFIAVYTAAIAVAALEYGVQMISAGVAVHSLIGIVLGLLLVFRTNTAYDRWWEGRRQWGALVNHSRSLAQKLAAALPEAAADERARFAALIGAYPHLLKEHLRGGVGEDELATVPAEERAFVDAHEHQPNAVVALLYRRVMALYAAGRISGDVLRILDRELAALTDVLGACERIRNTPIPYSYGMFMKKFIFLYVVTLPFGFLQQLGYWTIPAVVFLFYIFVSIELIAEEIEDPFGLDENDLPTDRLAERITADARELLLGPRAG